MRSRLYRAHTRVIVLLQGDKITGKPNNGQATKN